MRRGGRSVEALLPLLLLLVAVHQCTSGGATRRSSDSGGPDARLLQACRKVHEDIANCKIHVHHVSTSTNALELCRSVARFRECVTRPAFSSGCNSLTTANAILDYTSYLVGDLCANGNAEASAAAPATPDSGPSGARTRLGTGVSTDTGATTATHTSARTQPHLGTSPGHSPTSYAHRTTFAQTILLYLVLSVITTALFSRTLSYLDTS